MNNNRIRNRAKAIAKVATVTAATGLVALAVAAPAGAANVEYIGLSVSNCGTAGQLCGEIPTVTVPTDFGIIVEFTAAREHCSDIIAHIIIDGVEWGSALVGPGQRDGGYYIPVSPGVHDVGVQAEGITGGCNTGTLLSWGGTLRVETQ